jgi:hypothetical protein
MSGFVPCPTCGQYSHSIGEDRLAAAFNLFQSMYAHPVRGHPMGHNFDEATRDAAQVLMAAARAASVGRNPKGGDKGTLGSVEDEHAVTPKAADAQDTAQ